MIGNRFTALLFVILAFHAFGQRYSFIQYSTPEGLPQSQVNAIAQDEHGYLWIGTLGGLSRFNGRTFENFGTQNGLVNNRISRIYVDSSILIIGHDNGISISENKLEFTPLLFDNTFNVSDIIPFNDGFIITTNGGGIYKFERASKQLHAIQNSPERVRGATLFENTLYIATREGVYLFNEANQTFEIVPLFPKDSYSDIKTWNGSIYATIFDGSCYRMDGEKITEIVRSEKYRFRSVYPTKDGIWLNSSQGVLVLEPDNHFELTESSGLPVNNISTVFQDREGNVWLGSGGKGVLKFSGKTFTHFNRQSGAPSELITSILEDRHGTFWLSTFDKGIIKMTASGKFEAMDYPDLAVWNSAKVGETIYFGSNYGLYAYSNNKWDVYYSEDGLPTNRITGLYVDQQGSLLIGTSGGLTILNNGAFQTIEGSSSIDVQNVRNFCEVGDRIYLATQKGLKVFQNGRIELVEQFDFPVNSIIKTGDTKLWIGTENGLFVLENDQLQEVYVGEKTGVRYINFLVKDEEYVYAGTNNGLVEISVHTHEIQAYGINSGLIDLETNLNSGYITQNGVIWFGTASGLMRFDTKIKSNHHTTTAPRLQLQSFFLNFENDPVFLSQLKRGDPIRLAPSQNNLLFEFDGIFLTNPGSVSYTYLLEGSSEDWSPASFNSSINFNNLSPGKYQLLVKAQVLGGLSSEPFIIDFQILPPFYQTWWFYSLLLLFVLFSVFMFDRIRIQRIQQKNYQNNLEISNKLSRLEQQSLNASMNRHFIFNALNSIQYFINSSDKQSANRYLTRFAKLIRKNLDSSHMENGMVPLSDELERLELYLQLESMRFREKFDYAIRIDPMVETEVLKVPAMFLQPFVENSIIHGILPLENKKGEILISVSNHLDHIRIEIFDNGIGIENSMQQKAAIPGDHESHGMKITLGRIKLLQEISERSVELIGPHQINENDSSVKGTLVVFKFLKQYLEN
jgi:ligand-binding sensor domain-containing protein